jgi:hypothetical protein
LGAPEIEVTSPSKTTDLEGKEGSSYIEQERYKDQIDTAAYAYNILCSTARTPKVKHT